LKKNKKINEKKREKKESWKKKKESWKKNEKLQKKNVKKEERNARWITVVIHSAFGCRETMISPHLLVLCIINIFYVFFFLSREVFFLIYVVI
jgi:uncharacterized membrane protein